MATTKSMTNGARTTMPIRQEEMQARTDLSPTLWGDSPFAMMRRMMEDMDRMFGDWKLGRSLFAPMNDVRESFDTTWRPQIEMFEKGNKFIVQVDLPGLKKEDIALEVVDGNLVMRGERKKEHEEKREGFYRSERVYGSFYRTVPLPEGVTMNDISAHFKDGILQIEMPSPERPRKGHGGKIQIQ